MASLYRRTILASDSGVATVCRIPLLLTVTAWTLTWAGAPVWWRAMLIAAATLLAATYWLPADCTAWSSRMMILRSSTRTPILLASGFRSFPALPRRSATLNPSSFLSALFGPRGLGVAGCQPANHGCQIVDLLRVRRVCLSLAFSARRSWRFSPILGEDDGVEYDS